jgi:hypothetical protein
MISVADPDLVWKKNPDPGYRCPVHILAGNETFTRYKHCYPRQRFFAELYRTVHFLSSICSECIHCWSSCRGLVVRSLRQGYVLRRRAPPPVQYRLSCINNESMTRTVPFPSARCLKLSKELCTRVGRI